MGSEDIDLKDVDFHANWKLENTSKSFKSLKQSITEHREDTKSFTVEALLFESYLYMSDFNGNDNKDIAKAKKKNEEACCAIEELPETESIKEGYKSIYLALKCEFARKQSENYKELNSLFKKYEDAAEEDKRKFKASVCATKGFALSRLKLSRYEESENELKRASEICPKNVEWKFMLGLLKWRRCKNNIKTFEWSDGMVQVKEIMNDVLQLDADHAYAKTILADIYRREYEQEVKRDGHISSIKYHKIIFANDKDCRIIKILNLLNEAKENASRPRILSRIAKCYIRMGDCTCKRVKGNLKCSEPNCNSIYFKEAQNVIECAKQKYGQSACVLVQEAVLYREMNNPNKQVECLEKAITLQPSDSAAKMQYAKALASLGRHDDACDVYGNLLSEFKDDPFVLFDVNQSYAIYSINTKQYDEAVFRNNACLDIAVTSFVKNTPVNGPIEFIIEQQSNVNKVIKYLKKHFNVNISRSKGRDKVAPNLENAKLHEKIGDFENACSYYKDALQAFHYGKLPNTRHDEEVKTLFKFAKVNLKMGNFDVCSNVLAIIKCETCLTEKDVSKLTLDLFVAKGEKAAESGDGIKAIRMFTRATEMRSFDAAKRLLEETKKIKDNKLRMSALKCIASATNWRKQLNLKQELAELLPSCDDGSLMGQELKTLRECQLEMEYSILIEDDNISANISIVLQQGHNILNHAMEHFGNKHYPNSKARSVDFIIIPKVIPPETVEQRVQMILDKRQWKGFRNKFKHLLIYLVSIQPATNAEFKWLQDFVDLNNDDKHRRPVEISSKTIHVARNMCSNIEEILEEIYIWCWFTEKEPWIKK